MVVRIRLARFGCRNRPFYRLMAADSRSPRDGKHLEVLGYYNPLPGKDGGKRMGLKFDRVKYWLSVGAQPSDPVERILFRAGILPPPHMLAMTHKGGPCDRHPIDPMTGRPLDLEIVTVVDDPHAPESGCINGLRLMKQNICSQQLKVFLHSEANPMHANA
uniref:Ribosomal protein S16 n=1 Tax=Leersia perrieri TaxID=77586 RepID=A0A0D9X9T3_9ORYZ